MTQNALITSAESVSSLSLDWCHNTTAMNSDTQCRNHAMKNQNILTVDTIHVHYTTLQSPSNSSVQYVSDHKLTTWQKCIRIKRQAASLSKQLLFQQTMTQWNVLVWAAEWVAFQSPSVDSHSSKPSADTLDDSGTTTLTGEQAAILEISSQYHTHTYIHTCVTYIYIHTYLHRVREKKRPEYFGHNFDNFRHSCVIFGMNHPDTSLY